MNKDFIITSIDRIIYVGQQEYPERITRFDSNFASQELVFNFSSVSILHFDDQVAELVPDQIRYMPKGENHLYELERKVPGDCIDIFFQTDRPVSEKLLLHKSAQPKMMAALFRKAFSVWAAKNEGYMFECISILYRIFAEMQKEHYIPDSKYSLIRPAVDYVENHFYRMEKSCEELADLCGISYSYLNRLFREKYNMPPKRYIIQMQLNYACDLLQTREYTVTQVAEMAGFSDICFFSRQFREYLGVTPTEFQRKYISTK